MRILLDLLRLPHPNMLAKTDSLQEAKSPAKIDNILSTGDEPFKALGGQMFYTTCGYEKHTGRGLTFPKCNS